PGRQLKSAEPPLSHAALVALAADDAESATACTDPKAFSNTGQKTVSPNRVSRNHQENVLQDSTSNSLKKEAFLPSQQAIRNLTEFSPQRGQGTNSIPSEQATPSKSNTPPPPHQQSPAETAKNAQSEESKKTEDEKKREA